MKAEMFKKIKSTGKIIVSSALLFVFIALNSAFSQEEEVFNEKFDKFFAQLKTKLELTAEQIKNIEPLAKEHHSKLLDIKSRFEKANKREQAKIRGEFKNAQKEIDEKMKEILSSEQYQKLTELQKEIRNSFRKIKRL